MTHVAQLSVKQVWSDNPRMLLAVAGFAALLTGAVSYGVFKILATGDEPPIRVRHGSIILEVVHSDVEWRQIGSDQKHWKLSRGTRQSDRYQLYLAPSDPTHCQNTTQTAADVLRFVLDDNPTMWIEVKSVGRKTDVTSSIPLELSANERELSFGGTGNFVTSIVLDGTARCSFAAKDPGLHTFITE
jgi:ketosteroid isomerase-like protein